MWKKVKQIIIFELCLVICFSSYPLVPPIQLNAATITVKSISNNQPGYYFCQHLDGTWSTNSNLDGNVVRMNDGGKPAYSSQIVRMTATINPPSSGWEDEHDNIYGLSEIQNIVPIAVEMNPNADSRLNGNPTIINNQVIISATVGGGIIGAYPNDNICGDRPGYVYPVPVVVTWQGEVVVPDEPELIGFRIEPKTAAIFSDQTQQYRAYAKYVHNGSQYEEQVTAHEVSWDSVNYDVAKINSSGLAIPSGFVYGTVTITGTYKGMTDDALLTVKKLEPFVTGLEIRPQNATISVNDTQQYEAELIYSNGARETLRVQDVSWRSSNTSLAPINDSGVATGHVPGTVTITGTYDDLQDTATLNVISGDITGDFTITPNPVTYGDSFTFTETNIVNNTGKAIVETHWLIHHPDGTATPTAYPKETETSVTVRSFMYPAFLADITKDYEVTMQVRLDGEKEFRHLNSKTLHIVSSSGGEGSGDNGEGDGDGTGDDEGGGDDGNGDGDGGGENEDEDDEGGIGDGDDPPQEPEPETPKNEYPWVDVWFEKDGERITRAVPGDTVELHALYGDPDGDPLTRKWTYNDLMESYGLSESADKHTFQVTHIGRHDAMMTVTDPGGLTAYDSASLDVIDPTPVAIITGPPAVKQGRALPYDFDGSRSYSPIHLDLVEYEWTNKREVYDTPGNEIVKLRVQDEEGRWSEFAEHHLRVVPDEPPVAQLEVPQQTTRLHQVTIQITSYSPDLDPIDKHTVEVRYDLANNGIYSNWTTLAEGEMRSVLYEPEHVGRRQFRVTSCESFGLCHTSRPVTMNVVNLPPYVDVETSGDLKEPSEKTAVPMSTIYDHWTLRQPDGTAGDKSVWRLQNGLLESYVASSLREFHTSGITFGSNFDSYYMGRDRPNMTMYSSFHSHRYKTTNLNNIGAGNRVLVDNQAVYIYDDRGNTITKFNKQMVPLWSRTYSSYSAVNHLMSYDETIYMTARNPTSRFSVVSKLDPASGTVLKETKITEGQPNIRNPELEFIGQIDGNIYIHHDYEGIIRLDKDLNRLNTYAIPSRQGYGSLLRYEDALYLPSEDLVYYVDNGAEDPAVPVQVYAYRISDGTRLWHRTFTDAFRFYFFLGVDEQYNLGLTAYSDEHPKQIDFLWLSREDGRYIGIDADKKGELYRNKMELFDPKGNPYTYDFDREFGYWYNDSYDYDGQYLSHMISTYRWMTYRRYDFLYPLSSSNHLFLTFPMDGMMKYDEYGRLQQDYTVYLDFIPQGVIEGADGLITVYGSTPNEQFGIVVFNQHGEMVFNETFSNTSYNSDENVRNVHYIDDQKLLLLNPSGNSYLIDASDEPPRFPKNFEVLDTNFDHLWYGGATLRDEIQELIFRATETAKKSTGMAFRVQDHRNYYSVEFENNRIYLTKVRNGTKTTLKHTGYTLAAGSTYRVKVVPNGSRMEVFINDVFQFEATDSQFSSGRMGIINRGQSGMQVIELSYSSSGPGAGTISGVALVNERIDYAVSFEDPEGDPRRTSSERWVYTHNSNVFLNPQGTWSGSGQQQSTAVNSFALPGQYDFTFRSQDLPHPSDAFASYRQYSNTVHGSLRIHRAPIAQFTVSERSNHMLIYNDTSYDPDRFDPTTGNYSRENTGINYETTRGILERRWRWREASSATYNSGILTNPPRAGEYIIELAVRDEYGAWSDWYSQTITVGGAAGRDDPPRAGFTVSTSNTYRGVGITINSTAYDREDGGRENLDHAYYIRNVTTGGNESFQSNSRTSWAKTFSTLGTFEIRQVVRDSAGQTDQAIRQVTIRNRIPTAAIDSPGSTNSAHPQMLDENRPIFHWKYDDADGDKQQRYQVRVSYYNGTNAVDSGIVQSSAVQWRPSHPLPENVKLQVRVRVHDGFDWSGWSVPKYFMIDTNNPPSASLSYTPAAVWEGDRVTLLPVLEDPDQDPLTIRYTVLDPDGSSQTFEEMRTFPYEGAGPQFHARIPGSYRVTMTVTDHRSDPVSVTQHISVKELSVTGDVSHTPEWEQYRIEYNEKYPDLSRSENTFFAGEPFVLRAKVTDTGSSSTKAERVTVVLEKVSVTESLTPIDDDMNVWSGEMFRESFTELEDGTYTFTFTAVWNNGVTKHDRVAIRISDNIWRRVGIHRIR